jgi:hypothetical protein
MAIILIILAAALLLLLGWYGYRFYQERLERRMSDNEYNTAVTLWEFAKQIKTEIDQVMRSGKGVLNFTNITVPSSAGYRVSLELIGAYFRVHAVPARYAKTGRLSFVADTTLTVRAADHQGQAASIEDDEYQGVEASL